MKKLIVGCDPGNHGAFFEMLVNLEKNSADIIYTRSIDMPCVFWKNKTKKGNTTNRRRFSLNGIVSYAKKITSRHKSIDRYLFLESPNFFSTSKTDAAFLSGQVWSIQGVFSVLDWKVVRIKPRVWQQIIWKDVDIVKVNGKSDSKKTSENAAKRLFPDMDFRYTDDIPQSARSGKKSKNNDGLIDAALVALSGLVIVTSNATSAFNNICNIEEPWNQNPTVSTQVKSLVTKLKTKWKSTSLKRGGI